MVAAASREVFYGTHDFTASDTLLNEPFDGRYD